jgi:uncharacterized membrane protein
VILTDEPLAVSQALLQLAGEDDDPRTLPIPVTTVSLGVDLTLGGLPNGVIPSSLAAQMGTSSSTFVEDYVMRLDRQVSELDVARAGLLVGELPGTWADYLPRMAITILSFVLALGVAAIAVALGEAESRADQRTLLAVGANPGIRRRIAASRAGVLGLLAGVLAVPAGLIPAWGLLASRDVALVVPVAEIVGAVLILPLAPITGALLLSRPIPSGRLSATELPRP